MAVIRPVHTDSSNTAARGEFSLEMIIDIRALVIAKPIAAFNRLLPMTVHMAAIVVAIRSNASIFIVTLPISPLWAISEC